MKKILPLLALAAFAGSAFADEPTVFENELVSYLSPNGEWSVSCGDGQFIVRNLKTGESYVSEVDESAEDYYYSDGFLNAGYGNPVSNNGEVAGSTTYTGGAAVWSPKDGGTWTSLPVLGSSNIAHGITPDGDRIVGYTSLPGVTYYERATYSVPVLWTRNSEGGYDLTQLPYPTKDYTGRLPQYVIVHSISSDGKTIAGQVTDYQGYYHTPIVYHEQADGSWTYEYVHIELQNHGIEFPEYLEYDLTYPYEEDYMSEESENAYYDALSEYWNAGDWSADYPEITDYMTEEELAAYNAAYALYKEQYAEYRAAMEPFEEAYQQAQNLGVPDFEMNQVAMSQNGKYYAAYASADNFYDEYSYGTSAYTPYLFDLETGDYKIFEETNAGTTYVNNDGVVFGAQVQLDGYTRKAFAREAGADEFIPFHEYVASLDAEAGAWIAENCEMSYVYGLDYESEDDYLLWDEDVMSGLPRANEDTTVIASWVYDYWNDETPYFSYVIKLAGASTGVSSAVADKSFGVKVSKAGVISINGDAASVEVYNLQGAKVYSNNAPASTVQTGLSTGLYLVKATSVDGKKAVVKAAISAK